MPAREKLTMRYIREELRLTANSVSVRDISIMLGLPQRLGSAKAADLTLAPA